MKTVIVDHGGVVQKKILIRERKKKKSMKILAIILLSTFLFGCSDTGDLVLVGYKIDTTDRSYDRNGKVVGAKRNVYMMYKPVKP